jgi:hypothetical protein
VFDLHCMGKFVFNGFEQLLVQNRIPITPIIVPRDAGDVGQHGCLFHEVDQLFHPLIGHATIGEFELP